MRTRSSQSRLAVSEIVLEIARLDHRFAEIAATIALPPDFLEMNEGRIPPKDTPANLWGTIHCVWTDLLGDAIASLRKAVQLTDADLRDEFRIWRTQTCTDGAGRMPYSDAFKAKMVRKMTGPRRRSANALAQEMDMCQTTLSRWLREAGKVGATSQELKSHERPKRPEDWSPEEKLDVVLAAAALPERRCGPKSDPPNKLGPTERQRLLKVANAAPYRDLSPRQIVPKLADDGTYVAAESTFYRILGEEGQMSHRQKSRPPVAEGLASTPPRVRARCGRGTSRT